MNRIELKKRPARRRWTFTLKHALVLVCGVFMLGAGGQVLSQSREDDRQLLRNVRIWGCQFQNIDIDELRELPGDLLVIEPAIPLDPSQVLSRDLVASLKTKPDGSRRLVFAYLSVGEAAEYRSYWKSDWTKQPPSWVGKPDEGWPQAHTVRYWQDEWHQILYKEPGSMLEKILSAGFDGAFLDTVDAYVPWLQENPRAKQNMIELVEKLSSEAKRVNPRFMFMGQNAEELLQQAEYRNLIDAVSKESLLYGLHGENSKNSDEDVAWSLNGLNVAKSDGLPIFMIEYVTQPQLVDAVNFRARELGFKPFFGRRLLDVPPFSRSVANPASTAMP